MGNARNLGSLLNTSSTIQADDLNIGQLGNRNLIINGAMQVAQRGTSFTHSNVGTGGLYCLDRFVMQSDLPAMTYTVDQAADAPSETGLTNSFKITVTTPPASTFPDSSTRYFRIRHKIEAQDCRHLVNKPCTLSFWVKSSVTGQFDTTIFAVDSSSGTNHYVVPYTINSANTWEKKVIQFTGPATIDNNNDFGLDVQFQIAKAGTNYQTTSTEVWGATKLSSSTSTADVANTTNATFQITGVQLEVGDKATPFEHRSYGQELALCQRYFQLHGTVNFQGWNHNIADTGGTRSQAYSFPVTMRATPSITYQDNSGNSQRIYAEYPNSTSGNNITFNFYANSSCIMGFKYPYGNLYGSNGDSYMISAYALKLDAEL